MTTANTAAFLHQKSPSGELVRRALRPGSLLIVDEASMAGTFQLATAVDKAIKAGADVLLIGDPAQLGAVGAGGVFAELCRRHEVVELDEVQRFCDPETGEIRAWEAEASMALRRGDVVDALAACEAHGRIVGGTEEDLRAHLVEEVVQSRLPGQERHVLVVVGTEAEAAELSGQVRQRLVEQGVVDDRRTVRLADANVAGRGDVIQTRANLNRIQVANRDVWVVDQVNRNGSIWAVHEADGRRRLLGPDYVGHEVQLSYALTAHAAQGVTSDVAHALVRSDTSHAALYVAATLGRESNTIWVATDADGYTAPAERDPVAVLAELIEWGDLNHAAASTVEALHEATYGSLAHLGAVLEDLWSRPADGIDAASVVATFDPELADRLTEDPGLGRLERYLDQLAANGWDTEEAVRSVAAQRSFHGAESVADVLEWRLDAAFGELGRLDEAVGVPRPLVAGSPSEWIDNVYGPSGVDPAVDAVRQAVAERLSILLRQASEEPAPWVSEVRASSKTLRDDALATVVAYRDLSGYEGPDPIGPSPPLYARAERAAWRVARDTMAVAEVALPPGDFRVLIEARRHHRFLVEIPGVPERQEATQAVVASNIGRAEPADRVNDRAIRAEAFARALDQMGPDRQRAAQQVLDPNHSISQDHDYGLERSVDRSYGIEL